MMIVATVAVTDIAFQSSLFIQFVQYLVRCRVEYRKERKKALQNKQKYYFFTNAQPGPRPGFNFFVID